MFEGFILIEFLNDAVIVVMILKFSGKFVFVFSILKTMKNTEVLQFMKRF